MEPEIYDLYYRIASAAATMLDALVTGAAITYLGRRFCVEAGAKKFAWTGGAVYFLMIAIFFWDVFYYDSLFVFAVSITVAFGVLLALEKENRSVKIYLGVTFFTVRWISGSVFVDICFYVQGCVERWLILGAGLSIERKWRALFVNFCLFSILRTILLSLVLWGVCRCLVRLFFHRRDVIEKKELAVMLLPSVLGMLCYAMGHLYQEFLAQRMGISLTELGIEFSIVWIMMKIAILAVIFCIIYLNQKLRMEQEEKQSEALLAKEVQDMRSHIARVERLHTDMREICHDINHHVAVVHELLGREAYEEAKKYVCSFGQMIAESRIGWPGQADSAEGAGRPDAGAGAGSMAGEAVPAGAESMTGETAPVGVKMRGAAPEQRIATGNPVTDVILSEHCRSMTEKKIRFYSDFHYPDSAAVDAFDMSVILDNALSNAAEAAAAGGFVRISSFREHQAYLITVENSYTGTLAARGVDGLPVTGKQPAGAHGFGLRHIRSVAGRYHGDMTIGQKGDMVRLTVMLCV